MPARKPRYLKNVQFLVSDDLYARIVAGADAEDVLLSEFMREAIKDRLLKVEGRNFHNSLDPSRASAQAGAD